MNTNPKLCRYLHIPLQSGSQDILEAMARKYSIKDFRSFIEWAYKTVPDICIGTDIIVGFPGETKQHFDETVANLMTMPIHYFHVFSYSERKFARSTKKDQKVDTNTIAERSKILRKLSERKKDSFYNNQKGKQLNVLFESQKKGIWTGLTDNYIKVPLKSDENLKNKFHTITY
jgi:threonylcarbamoyladenosine tRNA methylthiotransferase MtaB